MSTPKTKAEAREQIARLQGEIESEKALKARHKRDYPKGSYGLSVIESKIASKKAKIAELRAKIPSLPK